MMIRRVATVVMMLSAVMAGPEFRIAAHEGDHHKIMGTVTMAAADHVMLKDRDGKDVTVTVTKETKVKSEPPMRVEEITAGTRVVITATEERDKSFKAETIEVGVASGGGR